MKKMQGILALVVLLVGGTRLLAQGIAPAAPSSRPASAAAVQVVSDPSKVCMMNDRVMGVPQIPVVVEGKTYYGCCAMCKKALNDRPETRFAVDPITDKKVDKALAVIGAQEDGRVFYFENEASFAKHNAKYAKK